MSGVHRSTTPFAEQREMAALLKAGFLAAALVTALACDTTGDGRNAVEGAEGRETAAANGGGPAPGAQAADSLRDSVPALPVSWRFEPPPTWDERVRLVDDPAGDTRLKAQGILSARHFEYLPRDTTTEAQTLLGVYVYDSTAWQRLGAQEGPPRGELVGRSPGVAYVVGLPQSNPFAPGSRDAAEFDRRSVTMTYIRRAFRVVP